jgi:predicted nucleic acid-binding protein
MRVYAESNFVLELVLEQEQGAACEAILELAERESIELALPAYALLEPYQTIVGRKKDREDLSKALVSERKQLQRTVSLASEVGRLQDAGDLLLRSSQAAFDRFSVVRERLIRIAKLLAVDASTLTTAEQNASLGLKFPDAVMLAAVYLDAAKHNMPSIFLNRNWKDFLDPDVKSHLASVGCGVIGSFDDGLARLKRLVTS